MISSEKSATFRGHALTVVAAGFHAGCELFFGAAMAKPREDANDAAEALLLGLVLAGFARRVAGIRIGLIAGGDRRPRGWGCRRGRGQVRMTAACKQQQSGNERQASSASRAAASSKISTRSHNSTL